MNALNVVNFRFEISGSNLAKFTRRQKNGPAIGADPTLKDYSDYEVYKINSKIMPDVKYRPMR